MTMPQPPDFNDLTDSQKLLVISLAVNSITEKVNNHEKVLITGNGTLPLKERVRNMEQYIEGTKYWVRFLVGALLLQTLTFGATAITYFIKLYPLLEHLKTITTTTP